ncbi:MAG: twin-arginine translocase TatA/TatE family subunit [Longimicrobiales bacterium]
MFSGIGVGEILLILGLVTLIFGAKRIPEIAKGLGSGIRNFKGSLKEGSDDEPGDS